MCEHRVRASPDDRGLSAPDSGSGEGTLLTSGRSQMADHPRCHFCGLPIEMRYGVALPRSAFFGSWAHLDTEEGIAAANDHEASR
jgi:hypothetical protein